MPTYLVQADTLVFTAFQLDKADQSAYPGVEAAASQKVPRLHCLQTRIVQKMCFSTSSDLPNSKSVLLHFRVVYAFCSRPTIAGGATS